jgi:two-component system phosphate regulon sensor histidine kinase PhoR
MTAWLAWLFGAVAAAALLALWRAHARDRAVVAALAEARHQLGVVRAEAMRLVQGLAGASEGLLVLDGDGRVVATNPAALELAALPANTVGRRLADVLPWPGLEPAITEASAGGEPRTFEIGPAAANGRTFAVRVRGLAGGGAAIGIDDTSRLKQLESLRRDFVANVSHELKTPLAAIMGFVETLIDEPGMENATRQRFLERIARQTERLTGLVADLLTLSRLDDEASVREPARANDLAQVVAETVRDLTPLAERRGLQLSGALPGQPLLVRGDREALRQITGNLVDNAIKYTHRGQVAVQLAVRGDVARLEVADTGIGLSLEDQERVFERFYRVDRARSRDLGGTGLGLSIVKNTVHNLGGRVGVSSRLGTGSTFWIELPVAIARDRDDGEP